MKVPAAAFLLAQAVVPTAAVVHPTTISYETLLIGDDISMKSTLFKALADTGVISITGIPEMDAIRNDALSVVRDCARESTATQEHTFPDGTRRLTLATHSVPGGEVKINHKITAPSNACDSFDKASSSFRSTVATVTQVFANRVSSYFEEQESSLLSTANKMTFKTFADVVEFGEHLEHFHSYEKLEDLQDDAETIEMHTDQGIFIAFTPGRLLHHQDPSKAEMTSGFFIELLDGSVEEVEFSAQDDLVFMLGDGVNQYINDKLSSNKKKLRAVPHTLHMDSHKDSSSRVWYGRMVLPPIDAIHPSHGTTFGELRDQMISASLNGQEDDENNMGVGCSGGMVARDLSATTTCEDNTTYCWHRCMPHADYQVSHEICAARNLEVQCINPRLQIWKGERHGDFYPACADNETQQIETPFPTLEEFPRSEDVCTDVAFETFANVPGYDFSVSLPVSGAKFMWSVEGDEVRGRLAYNGLFGWLAFGFADPNGKKNGMHGSNILMALPGGNYTGFSGLDLDLPGSVNEYEIDPTMSPFRYWMTPLNSPVSAQSSTPGIESNECFTAMTFQQASIGSNKFNVGGSDDLIWGANGENAYVQYHGRDDRGRFFIEWSTGKLTNWTPAPTAEPQGDEHDDHDHDGDGHSTTDNATSNGHMAAHPFGFGIVVAMVALFGGSELLL